MLKNYLTSAFRFLKRNKLFAGINILGLSLALAVSFIILLFVINEMSYNTYFKNRKQIYRVLTYNSDVKVTDEGTPYILAEHLKDEFPQIKYVTPVRNMRDFSLKLNEEFIPIKNAIGCNSEVFEIFNLMLIGQQKNILEEPNSIVLSREQAQKFFPDEDPIGKELLALINNKEEVFVVKGVFDDIPVNSTFQADCFISSRWSLDQIDQRNEDESAETNWRSFGWHTWLVLNKKSEISSLNEQLRALEKKVYGKDDKYDFSLQNLSDVYFGSQHINSELSKGDLKNIQIFSAIAILVIIIAALNYIILSTAVSTSRSKEIGIRKTNGASTKNLRKQLLSESVILSILVLPFALLFAWIGKPYAEELFQAKLLIISSNIATYIVIYVTLTLFVGILSGLYTSSFLAKLNVISILTNSVQPGKRKSRIRYVLIIIQLVIFCSFISSALIIRSQYKYALNKDPGYYNKDILFVNMWGSSEKSKIFIDNIKEYPNVISAGGAISALPMTSFWPYPMELPNDKSKKVPIELLAVDFDFIETMGIEVLEGRSFSREFESDVENSYLLNEKAVKALGLTDPIGKKIDVVDGTVIGVVNDFNLHSFHSNVPPLLIVASDNYAQQVAVHYKTGTLGSILPLIKTEWEKIVPDQPFNYKVMDEFLKEVYAKEKNLSVILSVSTLISLLIASFGLFGLTLFSMKSQTKEIGIKKVCGSSGKEIIMSFLGKNFIMMIIAMILSIPLTILVMNQWLSNFSFRTDIKWWVFALAFIIASLVVITTVIYHAFRASRINPVEALRYE